MDAYRMSYAYFRRNKKLVHIECHFISYLYLKSIDRFFKVFYYSTRVWIRSQQNGSFAVCELKRRTRGLAPGFSLVVHSNRPVRGAPKRGPGALRSPSSSALLFERKSNHPPPSSGSSRWVRLTWRVHEGPWCLPVSIRVSIVALVCPVCFQRFFCPN